MMINSGVHPATSRIADRRRAQLRGAAKGATFYGMQTDNRFLDDLARLASGALGAAQGMRTEVETLFKQRVERWLASLDLVTREEHEAVKAMAVKARDESEALAARVAALEARLAAKDPSAP